MRTTTSRRRQGIFDASLSVPAKRTSGKAILARQREGDVSNYHYVDNLARAIRHAGRVIVSWIPTIYDTQRIVRIMGEDDSLKSEVVNRRQIQHERDEQTGQMRAVETVVNDLTVGTYDVTVSVGPAYSTMRQEAADAMVQFGQAWPKLMEIAGDKVVKSMDWPGRGRDRGAHQTDDPAGAYAKRAKNRQRSRQVQMQMDQLGQYVEMLHGQLQQAQAALADKDKDRDLGVTRPMLTHR